MKKTVFFLIGIIALTTAFCQEVFIYDESTETIAIVTDVTNNTY